MRTKSPRHISGLLAFVAVLASTAPASAQSPPPAASPSPVNAESSAVSRAQLADDEGRYADVLVEVEQALKAGDASVAELVELFGLEASAHTAFGDEDAAVEAFRRLLTLRPGFELPSSASPKLQRLLSKARAINREQPTTTSAPLPRVTTDPAHRDPTRRSLSGAPAPADAGSRWYRSGWLWGAVAVVAAGSIAITFVARSGGSSESNLGEIPLP